MESISRQEAAEQAGVSVEQVSQLLELGFLRPRADDRFTAGDVRRIGIVRDLYGQTVNIASRIADYARQGEVVVSQMVVESAEGAPVEFTDLGDVELKGVTDTLRLHAARRSV